LGAIIAPDYCFPWRISTFPDRAAVREVDSSQVRRLGLCLGDVPCFLPIGFAAWLLVCRRDCPVVYCCAPIGPSHRAVAGESLFFANRTAGNLSLAGCDASRHAYSRGTGGFDRFAVHPAQRHQPAGADLARQGRWRVRAIPLVRGLELRFLAGAPEFPLPNRAACYFSRASTIVVRLLRYFRGCMFVDGMARKS